jgi:putative serine protease PepD
VLPPVPPSSAGAFTPSPSIAQPPGVPRYDGPLPRQPVVHAAPTFVGPPPRPPRKERRLLWAAVGALVAIALIGGGFGLAAAVLRDNGDTVTTSSTSSSTTLNTSTSSATSTTGNSVAPPVATSGDEPAAAVAAAVGPSVVLIRSNAGSGSGIVYDKSGVIFTNAHVVSDVSTFDVVFANGRTESGVTVAAKDVARDIAILKVPARNDLVPIVFGKTEDVRVGQLAIAIGAPFGLDQSVTQGIISAVGRFVPSFRNCGIDMIQTDAPINPGNSGGALVDRQGRLIGMNTSIRTSSTTGNGNVGVGFAVPSNTVKATVEKMLRGETTDVAYLGLGQASVETSSDGVLVGSVAANSPAAAAGLREGDLITSLNGEKVTNFSQIRSQIQAAKPSDSFELKFLRDGASQTVRATLTISPDCRS